MINYIKIEWFLFITMLKNIVELNKHKECNIEFQRHEEYQYLNLLNDLLKCKLERGRNGNTLSGKLDQLCIFL